ncbi:MAG: cyclic-di-AMP receptor [Dehalococcoidia bacterium]
MRVIRGGGQKLMIMVVADADADKLIRALVSHGYPATKIGSTGGFLRRGNTTIMSGVGEYEVDEVMQHVQHYCHARTEFIPLQALPITGDGAPVIDPMEVRVGGAVVFILNIERMEKV